MTTVRILLLSDFHQGMAGQKTLWPNVRSKFLDDLKTLRESGPPWDLVIFTGDLTQRGETKEFTAFAENLDKIWSRLAELDSNPRLVAIPGNHDLVRPVSTTPSVRALRNWESDLELQEHFWTGPTNEYRRLVQRVFAPFSTWREKERRHVAVTSGVLPGDISSSLVFGDVRLGIVGLNSAFLQLSAESSNGRLAVGFQQLQGVCGDDPHDWIEKHDICLLLTHHPADWLCKPARDSFFREVFDPTSFPIHLFGHMHEPEQRTIAVGGGLPRHEFQAPSLFGLEQWTDSTYPFDESRS